MLKHTSVWMEEILLVQLLLDWDRRSLREDWRECGVGVGR